MKEFDVQPHLVGDQLELRGIQLEDFDALYNAASDKLIWEQHPNHDRYKKPVFSKWFEQAIAGQSLVVIDQKTKTIIGSSRYYEVELEESSLAIGYTFLARAYWGGRSNAELKSLMLKHAFQYVETVWFHIGADNIRSQKAVLKIGALFSHEGIRSGLPYYWYKLSKNAYNPQLEN